jgi:hypothetical protein
LTQVVCTKCVRRDVTDEPGRCFEISLVICRRCAAGLFVGRAGEDECADDIVSQPDADALRRSIAQRRSNSPDSSSTPAASFWPPTARPSPIAFGGSPLWAARAMRVHRSCRTRP